MARRKTGRALGIGAGMLATAAAAGAGYYFYGDKRAKKHRKAASKWAKGMKRDVLRDARKLQKVNQKALSQVVDRAAKAYRDLKSVDRNDLRAAATELKRNWREIEREVGGRVSALKKRAKRVAKKTKRAPAKKKSAKKAAKKRPKSK